MDGDHKEGVNGSESRDMALNRMRSAQSITMSPEMFEKLYLAPQHPVKGHLLQTFGNPTPLAITGFVIGLTPLSIILMQWRGSGALGAAILGCFWFISGPALWIGGILEFFLGNTFSFVVFIIYGGVFFGWAAELTPWFSVGRPYDTKNLGFYTGEMEPAFFASLAYWVMVMSILSFIYMICALRINAVFFMVFIGATLGFGLLSAAFFVAGNNNMTYSVTLQKASGAAFFATALLGWYLIFVQMFEAVGIPLSLPVGDLTFLWERKKKDTAEGEA